MNKKVWGYLLLGLILALGIWLRTYNLPERYGFGWDQQDDAVKVMKMVNRESFTLIGPRVAGPNSFFVPAWHYYFLVPFYYLGNGSPWSGLAASLFVGMGTVLGYYFTAKKLWGEKVGLLAAWGGTLAFSIVSWNVMYTPVLTILVFYLGNRMFEDKKYVLPAIILAFFAGTTHLVPASLLVMILLGTLFLKTKPKLKSVLLGLLLGSLSLLPLLIFDIRHDFLNTKKIMEFVGEQGSSGGEKFNLLAWRAYYRGFSFMTGFDFSKIWFVAERVALVLFVLAGILLEKNRKKGWWYLIWFVLPAIILLFYHQNIPEYYFGVPIALLPIFIAKSAVKNKGVWAILFLLVVSVVQVKRMVSERSVPSLTDKIAIVNFMIEYSQNRKFNFSYNVPFGDESGYPFLFSWLKKEPTTTNDSRLYTLITLPEKPGERVIYSRVGLGILER